MTVPLTVAAHRRRRSTSNMCRPVVSAPSSILPGPGAKRRNRVQTEVLDCAETLSDENFDTFSEPWRRRMLSYLHRHGAFPASHRAKMWRRLMGLPRDEAAYATLSTGAARPWVELLAMGSCAAEEGASDVFASLAAWAPALADLGASADRIAMAFAGVFGKDAVLGFEASAFYFLNWGLPKLESFPSAPFESLRQTEDLLRRADPELVLCLEALGSSGVTASSHPDGVSSSQYGAESSSGAGCESCLARDILWPLTRDGLTQCLPRAVWLCLWDHIVTRWREGPVLLDLAACAVLRCLRASLLALPLCDSAAAAFECELRRPRHIPAAKLLEEFYKLHACWKSLSSRSVLPCSRLPFAGDGTYPPLLVGTHFVIDYNTVDRLRVREDTLAARKLVEEAALANERIDRLAAAELEFQKQQHALVRTERARRELALRDDLKLEAERRRCASLASLARVKCVEKACTVFEQGALHEAELYGVEAGRREDENSRRRRVSALEKEFAKQQLDLAEVEGEVLRDLNARLRQRRSVALAAELRERGRATLLSREQQDEAQRRLDAMRDEDDVVRTRMEVEQQIEAHQIYMADLQRQEIESALALDEQERAVHLGRVALARAARVLSRNCRADLDNRLELRQRWLNKAAAELGATYEAKLQEARRHVNERLNRQRNSLTEAQLLAETSLEARSRSLREQQLTQELRRFDEDLHRLLACDEAASEEMEQRLQAVLQSLRVVEQQEEPNEQRLHSGRGSPVGVYGGESERTQLE